MVLPIATFRIAQEGLGRQANRRHVRREDSLPLEFTFQGRFHLKVKIPSVLGFFQVSSHQVLEVILELFMIHWAKEVSAELPAAGGLPDGAL